MSSYFADAENLHPDVLAMERAIINNIVPLVDQGSLNNLYQNAALPKESLIKEIFKQSLKQFDLNYKDNLKEDTKLIHTLFPSVPTIFIKRSLQFFGSEPNRVRLCIRLFINNHVENGHSQNNNNDDNPLAVHLFGERLEVNINRELNPVQVGSSYNQTEDNLQNKRKLLHDNDRRRKRKKELLQQYVGQGLKPSTSGDTRFNTPINLTAQTSKQEKPEVVDLSLTESLDDDCDALFEHIDLTNEMFIKKEVVLDESLLSGLMEIFPDACPDFLRELCKCETGATKDLNSIIDHIFSMENYPKREIEEEADEIDYEKQLEILKQVLPDADPLFLEERLLEIYDQHELKLFISEAVDLKNYPKYNDTLRRQQLSAQAKQYTTEFNVEQFLELFPNPVEIFHPKSKRKFAENCKPKSQNYYSILNFLKNHYKFINIKHITKVLDKTLNIFHACEQLDCTKEGLMKSARKTVYSIEENIPLLQLFAFLEHKEEILEYKARNERLYLLHREQVKQDGLMVCCQCCFDEEVMPEDVVTCPNGCIFCRECVQRAVEVAFGDGILDYDCLAGCNTKFTLQILQSALKPKLFSKLAQKKQMEEVKAAGIEDLEQCPFCEFATIPPQGDKIFKCLNRDCMKESCRSCKEPSHLPLRCNEVEKDSDVQKRTFIENKMTEALLRVCWKCGLKFIKESGCNKMTCSCGAMLCYICKKPVKDYSHFNGQGGSRFDLCPLYSDTNMLHQQDVMQGVAEAKNIVGNEVKVDPSANIKEHFKEIAKKNPIVLPPGVVPL